MNCRRGEVCSVYIRLMLVQWKRYHEDNLAVSLGVQAHCTERYGPMLFSHINSEYTSNNGKFDPKRSSDCTFPNSSNGTQHIMSELVFGRRFLLVWLLKQYNVHRSIRILAALTIDKHKRTSVNWTACHTTVQSLMNDDFFFGISSSWLMILISLIVCSLVSHLISFVT